MLKDGSISYSSVPSPLLLWEPENSVLNTLFLGFLTTIMSVQATAVVFDLLLGLKPAAQVSLNNLHSLLLVWSFSPLSVLNNVMRKDWITRRYYKGDIPEDTKIERNQIRIRRRVIAKLFLLLSTGPIINIVAIAAVLEREKDLSIRESGLGGLGWGVNMDLGVGESYQITETCRQYNISSVFKDEVLVQFSSCNLPFIFDQPDRSTESGLVSVGVQKQSEIFVTVFMYGWSVTAPAVPQLFANETFFDVKHALSDTAAALLVDKGIELVAAECAFGDVQGAEEEFLDPPDSLIEHIHTKKIPCSRSAPVSEEVIQEQIQRIGRTLREYITFVKANRLELSVANGQDEEASFIDPTSVDNILFLRRRERNLSLAMIGIISAVLIAIRIITASFLNNDVAIAIELAVKRSLQMGIYQSFLQKRKAEVSYNNKFQNGELAHYGLMRFDLPMVKKFEGGIIGKQVQA